MKTREPTVIKGPKLGDSVMVLLPMTMLFADGPREITVPDTVIPGPPGEIVWLSPTN